MTAEERDNLARIEKDRRRRELLLLLLLLSYSGRAERQARSAVRVGANPIQAAAHAIQGRGAPGVGAHVYWPSLAARVLPVLAEAYAAGIVRAGRMAGVTIDVPDEPEPTPGVRQQAEDLAEKTTAAVSRIVTAATEEAAEQGVNGAKRLALIGEAFDQAGMSHARSSVAETASERAVCTAYNGGMFEGFEHKSLLGRVTGFKYVAVLDEVTTTQCKTYNGVKLPKGHPWLLHHWPPCHWNCRSVCLPLFGAFTPTAEPPYFPEPLAGFGAAPILAYGTLVGR